MAKKIISPGQALLLLIDAYRDDPFTSASLKQLYLSGNNNAVDKLLITTYLSHPALNEFEISQDIDVINDDPSRRYFETHLAYNTLICNIENISTADLQTHYNVLLKNLPKSEIAENNYVLKGEFKPSDDNPNREYADYIAKMKSGELFSEFDAEQREKIELIIKISYLATLNTSIYNEVFPLHIYGVGIFQKENRGKEEIKDKPTIGSEHAGIMTSKMPVAHHEDAAHPGIKTSYVRPADQARFVKGSQWVTENFERLVHPFSNSISGTTLCQLRTLAQFKSEGKYTFVDPVEDMAQFIQLFVSTMLYTSGGHSLHEYTAPLALPAVKREFRDVPGFDTIDLKSMFVTNNENAFEQAVEDSIQYNNMLLLRSDVKDQITGDLPSEGTNAALSFLQYKQEAHETISQLIEDMEQAITLIKSQSPVSEADIKTHALIQDKLHRVIKFLTRDNLEKAKDTMTQLKNDLGDESHESYAFIESIETDIEQLITSRPQIEEPTNLYRLSINQIKSELIVEQPLQENNDTDVDDLTNPFEAH